MSARGLAGGAAALGCLALVGCEAVLGLGDPVVVGDGGVSADAPIDQASNDGSSGDDSSDDGTSDAPSDSTLDSPGDAGPGDAPTDSPLPDASADGSVGPVLLVPQGATLVVVGGGAVYYALANGVVEECSAPDCTGNVGYDAGATVLSLATDGTNLYWGSAGGVQGAHCTVGASCQPQAGPVPEAGTALGMTVSSARLYWGTNGDLQSAGVPLDGGAAASVPGAGPFGGTAIVATKAGALAWISGNSCYYLAAGTLQVGGTGSGLGDAAPPNLQDIASDGVTAYAVDSSGQLYTVTANASQTLSPLSVTGGPDAANAIAVDDASVYVASSTGVSYVASTGGQMTTLADAGAVDIAVDDKYVYFVNAQGLWRVAKP